MAEYRQSLLFFADLFEKLAAVATAVDELNSAARVSGKFAADRQEPVSLEEAEQLLSTADRFPQKSRLRQLAAELRQLDVRALTESYWKTVYGIYEAIPHPVDPRAQARPRAVRPLPLPVRDGRPAVAAGAAAAGDRQTVSACTPGPHERRAGLEPDGLDAAGRGPRRAVAGQLRRTGPGRAGDFQDQGYRWLVVRLTEGPQGGRKTIAVSTARSSANSSGTGPPVSVRERMVGHCAAIRSPPASSRNGRLEIRFSDPGIAIAAVALAAERLPDTD